MLNMFAKPTSYLQRFVAEGDNHNWIRADTFKTGSVNLQFLLGVQATGSFKFFVNIEALP